MADFLRVKKDHPCKICGRPDYCTESSAGPIAKCMRVSKGAFKSAEDGSGLAYFHRLTDQPMPVLPVRREGPIRERGRGSGGELPACTSAGLEPALQRT